MDVTKAHLPVICNTLSNALKDYKMWVAYNSEKELLSSYDLHFFKYADKASEFKHFNEQNDKEVHMLPTNAMLTYLTDTDKELQREGKQFSQIPFDDEKALTHFYENKFGESVSDMTELLDSFDWKKTHYDPLEANTEAETFQDKIQFIHLEYLMEQLSRFAVHGSKERDAVEELTERYWKGESMEVFTKEVVAGHFHLRSIIDHNKTKTMTEKNLEYLENQLKFAGFNGLGTLLERNMKEGLESFQLPSQQEFGKDKLDAVLHFAKSKQEGTDMYFFNRYDATMSNDSISATQSFFINNKGQSITAPEACNLLNGRSVYKEVTPAEGDKYKAWLKLDFAEREENGNAKLRYYNQNYGFNLKEAIQSLPLKKFSDPEKMEQFFVSLQRGDLAQTVLLKGGREIDVLVAADPKFKTVKMYDTQGNKLYVPGPKQETKHGQAPVDAKREQEGTKLNAGDKLEAGENGKKKVDLLAKDDKPKLMEKKRVRKNKGQGIS